MTGDGSFFETLISSDPDGFATAMAAAGIGVWYADFGDGLLHPSSYLRTLTGIGEQEFLPRQATLQRLIHPDDFAHMTAESNRAMVRGTPYEGSHRTLQADGSYAASTVNVVPIHDESGEIIRAIGIIRNQDELELSRNRLHKAEITAGLGHLTLDVTTGSLFWSDGVYHIQGIEPGDVELDREFAQSRYVDEDIDEVKRIVADAAERGVGFEYRARVVHESGGLRHVKVIGEVEKVVDGRGVLYSGVVQDITDEVRRETQIRHSQKMEAIGNMTGGAAHDFNNMLAVILGNLELLREKLDSEELNAYCDAALAATLHGSSLTRNMLSFARKAQLNPETIDINEAVRGMAQWTRRTLPANIETEVSLLAGLWKVDVDAASLESALLNLILNARDAMPDGGRLTIETSNTRIDAEYIASRVEDVEPGRYVMLAVSDTGEGIPPENLDTVFEPFFTTKGTGAGSGLGLSMVEGFVKQSSGAVRIYSEVGVGTTFKLYFPATDRAGEAPRARGRHDAATPNPGGRILLAEDEAGVREVLVDILTLAGFEVHGTSSGDEAKSVFDADPTFDVLITDIVMPGALQGTTLATALRASQPSLPVIFMSGYANEATVHGNGLRPDDIRLMKPIRRADLLAAVGDALSRAPS